MDLVLLILLVAGAHVVMRFAANASVNSANEDQLREMIRERIRKKRIDELYGRGSEDEEG